MSVENEVKDIPVDSMAVKPVPVPMTMKQRFSSLLPSVSPDLTEQEQVQIQRYQESHLVLGVAAAAVMICTAHLCPVAETCPLQQIQKAPAGQLCPLEANYVVERFAGWMMELGKSEHTMSETERSSIAQLVTIDIQEKRCLQLMSIGKAASMTDLSVKEIDLETGDALSYEKIVHANQQIIQELRTARRMLLDDMERSEKAKTRKIKIQLGSGKDLSSMQSSNADKIRTSIEGEVVVT